MENINKNSYQDNTTTNIDNKLSTKQILGMIAGSFAIGSAVGVSIGYLITKSFDHDEIDNLKKMIDKLEENQKEAINNCFDTNDSVEVRINRCKNIFSEKNDCAKIILIYLFTLVDTILTNELTFLIGINDTRKQQTNKESMKNKIEKIKDLKYSEPLFDILKNNLDIRNKLMHGNKYEITEESLPIFDLLSEIILKYKFLLEQKK